MQGWVTVLITISLFAFDTLASATTSPPNSNHSPAVKWQLTWSDEFEGKQLDLNKWAFDIGNGFILNGQYISGWGNRELQAYTNHSRNVGLNGQGQLVIQARVESSSDSYGNYRYSSARLKTQGLFAQRFGRFEARIKLPTGQGLWPAFWLMPQDNVYGTWAASGEIDIMEARGSAPSQINGTIHYGAQWPNNTYSERHHIFSNSDISEFHVYRIDWSPQGISWYVDEQLYATQSSWFTQGQAFPAPFDQHFYLIINLAVGGNYDGNPISDRIFPAQMEVDYLRVYQAQD
ncbi:glycoside hydrolase family 16 protein [Agarivorans sp. MS3-6]|uniref:glycoside hydrolase family 16 protein n=1 Tax=Agarivorans sp. TSD2052 TaxID=2937286 RepID=UPI00200F7923|nr:glycoside hydrolase family 16 protein [Agarivorans sp. TSD2052]UPW19659.1 glycoside hydrolase family 16 protein [Agarivorans sp. TSD2052]